MLASPISAPAVTRPILDFVMSDPAAGAVKVEGVPLAKRAPELLQFAVVGEGPMGGRSLVPQTAAAAGLLASPDGPRVEQALRGMLGSVDASAGAAQVQGVTLSRTIADFAANSALAALEANFVPGWDAAAGRADGAAFDKAVEYGGQVATGAYAQAPEWVNIGPLATNQLLRLTAADAKPVKADGALGTWIASLATHELGHRITPAKVEEIIDESGEKLLPVNWLEEGSSTVLATWGDRPAEVATAMGLPFGGSLMDLVDVDLTVGGDAMMGMGAIMFGNEPTPEQSSALNHVISQTGWPIPASDHERAQLASLLMMGESVYPKHAALLNGLLSKAGLDARTPADFAKADELLQGGDLTGTPDRLGSAIAAHHGIDASKVPELAAIIRDAGIKVNQPTEAHDGMEETTAAVDAWIAAAKAASSVPA